MSSFILAGTDGLLSVTHNITAAGTSLKGVAFKNMIEGNNVDRNALQQYLATINSILLNVESYADDVASKMRHAEGREGVQTIPYDSIKPYLYGIYDYAAALPFTDGVIRIINDSDDNVNGKVKDFFEHTASKAFKGRADSVGGLVDEVVEVAKEAVSATLVDTKMFNAIKTDRMFSANDRRELYKAVEGVVKLIESDLNKNRYIETRNVKSAVSFINNVVEFLSYSIIAYVTRVWVIGVYANPFIIYVPMDESVDPSLSEKLSLMSELDETLVRDRVQQNEFITAMSNFVASTGSTLPNYNASSATYYPLSADDAASNIVVQKLIGNRLYEFLRVRVWTSGYFDDANGSTVLTKLQTELKDCIDSNTHSLSTSSTPKQDLLQILRDVEPKKDSKEGYSELAADVGAFIAASLSGINTLYRKLARFRNTESDAPKYNNSVLTVSADLMKSLDSLYKEIAVVGLMKLRDIEMKINVLSATDDQHVADVLSIKVPDAVKSDYSQNDNMMVAVPDTGRTSSAIMTEYARPELEYLNMYTEYAKMLLPNDEYLTEAAGFLNATLAFLEAIRKAILRRWNDAKFKAARDWVAKHDSELKAMKFNGTIEVLPYEPLKIDYMDDVESKLRNGMTPYEIEDPTKFDKFIKTLYPPALDYLFNEDKSDDTAKAERFRNWVLFGIDTKSTDKPAMKKLTNEQIESRIGEWVNAVNSSDNIMKELVRINDSVKTAVNGMESKFRNTPNRETVNGNDVDGNVATKEHARTLTPEVATAKLQKALNDLWKNLEPAIYGAISDQYRYIQQAWAIGTK